MIIDAGQDLPKCMGSGAVVLNTPVKCACGVRECTRACVYMRRQEEDVVGLSISFLNLFSCDSLYNPMQQKLKRKSERTKETPTKGQGLIGL